MVLFENQIPELDSSQHYYGECESLLANCCSKTRLTAPFKFRPMNRQRRQMAFDMLRQMKLQEQKDIFPNRSKRRRNKKRFYRKFCCTGKDSRDLFSNSRNEPFLNDLFLLLVFLFHFSSLAFFLS